MSQNCGKLDMKAKDREEVVMTTRKSSLESIPLDLTIESSRYSKDCQKKPFSSSCVYRKHGIP